MVVLVSSKLNHAQKRLHAKLDHLFHHHHQQQKPDSESALAALEAFRAEVSGGLQGLVVDSKEVSFSWLEQGFKLLQGLNRAFVKLIEDLDCPMSKWESALVDEYLSYSLDLLDLLNSMSSSLAYLQHVRLSLAHALSLLCPDPQRLMQSIDRDRHQPRRWANHEGSESQGGKGNRADSLHGNQGIVLQAVVEMKAVALWVCRAIVSGLGGEIKHCSEFRNPDHGLPLLLGLNSRVYEEVMDKGLVLKEVKEVNEMVARLSAAQLVNGNGKGEESSEMQRKLERFESKLDAAVKEVNCLFSEVLASRNKLLDCFRLQKQ